MTKYRKLKKQTFNQKNYPILDTNSNTIHIKINSSEDILSAYSEDNRVVINNEFADFLENAVKDISIKEDLTIKIESKDKNKERISSAIKNYYYNEFIDSERRLKQNLLLSIITLLFGAFVIACNGILQFFDINFVIIGTIDILAWVFIWESFDLFFFRRREIKHEQFRQMNFVNATIDI